MRRWMEEIKPKLLETFPTVNLPYIKTDDGVQVSCQWPILNFLAARYDYLGDNEGEKACVLTLNDYFMDVSLQFARTCIYAPKGPITDKFKYEVVPKFLKPIDAMIKKNAKKFACSDRVTLTDFVLFWWCSTLTRWWPCALDAFAHIRRVFKPLCKDERLTKQREHEFSMPITASFKLAGEQLTDEERNVPHTKTILEYGLPDGQWGLLKRDGSDPYAAVYDSVAL